MGNGGEIGEILLYLWRAVVLICLAAGENVMMQSQQMGMLNLIVSNLPNLFL